MMSKDDYTSPRFFGSDVRALLFQSLSVLCVGGDMLFGVPVLHL
jgi:hypothetical protein